MGAGGNPHRPVGSPLPAHHFGTLQQAWGNTLLEFKVAGNAYTPGVCAQCNKTFGILLSLRGNLRHCRQRLFNQATNAPVPAS